MWTEIVLIGFVVLRTAASARLPIPTGVHFSSVNLRTVLHWSPGHGSPEDTRFTVEYAIYGETTNKRKGILWRPVRQCMDIGGTWCDLSAQMQDLEQAYYARVRALRRKSSSKWAETQRYDLKTETVFGPPSVTVEIENNSATVTLVGPMRYSPTNHSLAVSMNSIYPHTSYNLFIHNTYLDKMHHIPVSASPYKYQLMAYNTKYCFSAKSRFVSIEMRSESSPWHCLTTPKDPVIEQLQKSLVGIVVPFLCLCVILVVGCCLYSYLSGKDQKSPHILKPISFSPPPLKHPPENVNLIVISTIGQPPHPNLKPKIAAPPSGYASQNLPEMPFQEQDEHLDESSIDYSTVSKQDKTGATSRDEGDDGNDLMCEHHTSGGNYAPQLASCLCQRPTHEVDQSNHSQTEASALLQAQPWSQVSQSSQGSVVGCEEASGLFISRNLQTGLFDLSLNIPKLQEGEEIDEKSNEDNNSEIRTENVPLLSGYAAQTILNMHPVPNEQSPSSPDYCGVVTQRTKETEGEKEEGNAYSYRNDEIRRRVLPQMDWGLKKEGGWGGLKPSEIGEEDGAAGRDEAYMIRDGSMLKGLLLKQSSEEEDDDDDAEWEVNELLNKWNLVIS
ncbi:interleukin-20 receptor subunit alpha [Nothobranchius furzeri]|uniref:Interleukin-10 receptor subunit alpha-like n=1 Tax=Nothobranchius furzeri TaxID=105023 RepID=A0A9D2Z4E7_NOTFU|nr:interleukin-20 receptor subunit alpha [Nothobranchius furzeri]KAF7231183.1 interleukin-10 receptor subunit alpha-like [Nothobranchius furzeri]